MEGLEKPAVPAGGGGDADLTPKPWHEGHEEEAAFEIGGEKLSLKQLREGYLRQADYTRKTQETAELRKQFEASQAKPPIAKPGEQVLPQTVEDWNAWSGKLYQVFGPDPGAKLTELVNATASEQLTVYDVTKEVNQALKETPRLVETIGGGDKEKARRILWNELREEMQTDGSITATDVAERLLKGLPKPIEEPSKPKGKMKPEREGSPAGAEEKPPEKFDKRGEITVEYSAWVLKQARDRGEIPPAE